VVEHLPSKLKAKSSNPVLREKKKKERERESVHPSRETKGCQDLPHQSLTHCQVNEWKFGNHPTSTFSVALQFPKGYFENVAMIEF
jgi:hypothetical protein